MQRSVSSSIRRWMDLIVAGLVVAFVPSTGLAVAGSPITDPGREDLKTVRSESGGPTYSTWRQSGQRWVSISKDDGETWSEPRAMIDAIPLAAGVIVPGESIPAVPKGLEAGDGNRVFLVQFETQSLAEWRRQLRALGVEVLTYVPHNSHLVRMDQADVSTVEALPFVRWVGAFEPSYRAAPALLGDLRNPDVLTRRFRLQTFVSGPVEKASLATEIQAVGGQVVLANPEGYIVEAMLTDSQALALLSSNHLQWIEEWSAPEEDMDNGRIVAGADYVAATPAGYDGTGVRAEVCDGGVDTDHPDFINPVPVHGAVNSAGTSHGTCTYGINFGNGSGSAAATGMVPQAYGYFAYYNALSNRYTHTAELVDPALEYKCVYQSNSWGDSQTVLIYNSTSAAMDDIIWTSDIIIFQSQSNTGSQLSRAQAWAKNIVSVGGAYHSNNTNSDDDRWNGGASVGPAADGRIKPDLTFFYDAIYTTDADPGGYTSSPYNAGFGGTSGATPMVAGTSGLFFQMWADNVWRPHFTTMKALLINNAEQYDWTAGGPNADLTRVRQGWGRPNAQNAYDRAPMTAVVDETSVLQELEKDTYTATVPAAQDALKITMVYADRAGVPGTTPHRINDVTLKVTAPDSTVYWGNNGLTDGLWSTPGGAADTINTVENVFIQNPAEGVWTIEVEAVEVNMDVHIETPEDDQDYALVVYGVTNFFGGFGSIFGDGFESGDTGAWAQTAP
jgi:serine protease AprX